MKRGNLKIQKQYAPISMCSYSLLWSPDSAVMLKDLKN